MPVQRQRNVSGQTRHLVETADDGAIYPARAVDPGETVDWPARLAGFDGWKDPDPPETPAPADAQAEPEPPAEPATATKPRKAGTSPAATSPEVTA